MGSLCSGWQFAWIIQALLADNMNSSTCDMYKYIYWENTGQGTTPVLSIVSVFCLNSETPLDKRETCNKRAENDVGFCTGEEGVLDALRET